VLSAILEHVLTAQIIIAVEEGTCTKLNNNRRQKGRQYVHK
jgi:hypothetical protein